MLRLALITVWTLMIPTDQTVNGYTITNRNRNYSNGYSTTGGSIGSFVSLSKEPLSDLTDQLSSSSAYIPSNSQRYSASAAATAANSHSSPTSSYSSAAYMDSAQSNGYAAQSANTPETSKSITSSYSNDARTSSDTNPSGYTVGSGSADGYSSSSGHNTASFSGYVGSQSDGATGLSGKEHATAIEYNFPSASAYPAPSSPLNNYMVAAPKAAAYTMSSHGHVNSPFTSGHNFISNGHSNFPGGSRSIPYPSNHLSSYPGNRYNIASYLPGSTHSSHNSYSDSPRYSSSSLTTYLSPHSSNGASNYIPNSVTSPLRGGIPSYMLGTPTNINPTYAKGPGSFYPGSGAFSKSGNKYIIIKESPGSHSTLMHPGEPNYPSRMLAGATGFKVKSAGPFSSGQHPSSNIFASGIHLSSGYPGAGGGHHSGGPTNSYYSYQ